MLSLTPQCRHTGTSPVDTLELKNQIFKKLGRQKAEKYFYSIKRLLSLKLCKVEFDKLCWETVGKENIALHNLFIRSILSNACLAHVPPSKQTVTGNSRTTIESVCHHGNAPPRSLRKGRSTNNGDRRFCDRPSPLGPFGKTPAGNLQEVTNSCDVPRSREQQSAPEFVSVGSKAMLEVLSVEEGEEVEQIRCSPSVQSRSPVRAPLGIGINVSGRSKKSLFVKLARCHRISAANAPITCYDSFELPDTRTLGERLMQKLELQGLNASVESVDLLNRALDVYIKRLITPCLELSRTRCSDDKRSLVKRNFHPGSDVAWQEGNPRRSNLLCCASLLDFRVAMELNPRLLGDDWAVLLEKICMRSFESK